MIATTTPAGQIVGVIGGAGQTVKVDFTTDDSNPASDLAVTPANLTSLPPVGLAPRPSPAPRSAPATVRTQPHLYAHSGRQRHRHLEFRLHQQVGRRTNRQRKNWLYDHCRQHPDRHTQSPSGTVNAVVRGRQPGVTVTFNSSDANPVSSVAITSGLGSCHRAGADRPLSPVLRPAIPAMAANSA